MRELTKDTGAEFSSEKPETSASTPISTTYSDCNQATDLSCPQTTVLCTSSTTVVSTTTSISTVFFPKSSNVLTCDATLPVTSSSILETAALLSGSTEYSAQGGFLVTSACDDEVIVYEEDSQIRVSTLQDDLHLSDSDSDDEASTSDLEYDKDLFDNRLETTNDNNIVQLRLSTINESPIDFSEDNLGSENALFRANASSSDARSISSSEDDSSTDTKDGSSDDDDDDNDSAVDDSSSSQSDASSTDRDESDEITNDPLMQRKLLHRASDVLLSDKTSTTGFANTGELSYPEARFQKRKREDEGLHYSSKRRKIESQLPSTSTGLTGCRKSPASGSIVIKVTLDSENTSFRANAASSDGESISSSEDNSSTDIENSPSDDDDNDSAVDDSSSSQSDASSTDSDESDEITNDPLMQRKPLHRASDVLLSDKTSKTEFANTEELSYPDARGQKRKRQDEGLYYPSKRRKIESPLPSTSTGYTGNRQRQAPGSIDKEAFNRVQKKKKMYLDSQIYSCPSTCPCKTRGRANRIPSIERTFKVIKPLYIKLLQSRTLESSNLSSYQCCKKYCSFRWFRRRVPNHVLLDDYWASDLDVCNFSWGQWKDGEGYV